MLAIREMAVENVEYLRGHAKMGKLTGTIDRRVLTSFFKEFTPFGSDGSVPGARSSAACGQEAVRGGLQRFRWGTAAAGTASLA